MKEVEIGVIGHNWGNTVTEPKTREAVTAKSKAIKRGSLQRQSQNSCATVIRVGELLGD